MRSVPFHAAAIDRFLAVVAEADGHPPLSERKVVSLKGERRYVSVSSDDEGICLVGVASGHETDGHWALEIAVAPRMRSLSTEVAAIRHSTHLVPAADDHTFWAFRTEQIDAAIALGYEELRSVLRFSGPSAAGLGVVMSGVSIGPMAGSDTPEVVNVNNRAFTEHREQGSMTLESYRSMEQLDWFDPSGVLVARDEEGVVGFVIAKHEGTDVGEIYLIAVDPSKVGMGVGRALATSGIEWLAKRGATTARVWVDEGNDPAVNLYERLGLAEDFRTREMIPPTAVSVSSG